MFVLILCTFFLAEYGTKCTYENNLNIRKEVGFIVVWSCVHHGHVRVLGPVALELNAAISNVVTK
jgi:hypothetical protein